MNDSTLQLTPNDWFKCDIDSDLLRSFMPRSNTKGLIYFGGLMTLITLTGYLAYLALDTWWVIPALFLYGTIFSFAEAAAHELNHITVFRSRWMNTVAHMITGFMAWREPVYGRFRHFKHHTHTSILTHDPEGEAARPRSIFLVITEMLLRYGHARVHLGAVLRHSFGIITTADKHIVPRSHHQQMCLNSRILLLAYVAVFVWSLLTQSWLPIIFLFLPRVYGTWLHDLCSRTQHTGMAVDIPDHRFTTRTVLLGPILRFFYWNMNYHIEHHLYPNVPFHALPKLHEAIKDQLPQPSQGLLGAWWEIWPCLLKQRKDPDYCITPIVPQ